MTDALKNKVDSIDKSKLNAKTKEVFETIVKGLRSKDKKVSDKSEELLDKLIKQGKDKNADIFVAEKTSKASTQGTASQVKSRRQDLFDAIQNDPKLSGFNKFQSVIEIDAERIALPRGKRVSKKGWKNQYGKSTGGRTYYETRENRMDRKAPIKRSTTAKPWLEYGGEIEEGKYIITVTDKNGVEKVAITKNSHDEAMAYATLKKNVIGSNGVVRIYNDEKECVYTSKMAKGGYMAKGGEIGNYRVIPYKRISIEGSPDLLEPYYSLAFTVVGSLSEANERAQKYIIVNDMISATITKIHPSGQPLKNKKVSYVTKDEILKYEDGGYMTEGGKYYVMDAKDGRIVSKGFDTEEEAKVEKYRIFEMTSNPFLTQKKMANGGYMAKGGLTEFDYDVLNGLQGYNNGLDMNGLLESMHLSNYKFNKYADQTTVDRVKKSLDKLLSMGYVEKGKEIIGYKLTQEGADARRAHLKKYEDGGYMAKGGKFEKPIPAILDDYGNIKSEKTLQQDLEYLKEAYENKQISKYEYDEEYNGIKEQIKFLQKYEDGGYMAEGGEVKTKLKDYKSKVEGYFPNIEPTKERSWYLLETPQNEKVSFILESRSIYSDVGSSFLVYDKNYKYLGSANLLNGFNDIKRVKITKADVKFEDGGYMAKGGAIENQYEGRTAEDIWDSWTKEQKMHFLDDHNDEFQNVNRGEKRILSSLNFSDIEDDKIVKSLQIHLKQGQYAKGGKLTQGDINKEVNQNIEQYLKGLDKSEQLYVLREIFKEALVDANFGEFQDKVDQIFKGAKKFVLVTNAQETEQLLFDVGQQVARTCTWDRFKIKEAMQYTCSMNGYGMIASKISDIYSQNSKKLSYVAKNKVKYFLIKNEGKSKTFNTIYDIYESKDVLNGANVLENGGELSNYKYYPKSRVIIIGEDGKRIFDKVNGAWVKKSATPIGEIESTEILDVDSWDDYLKNSKSKFRVDSSKKVKRGMVVTKIADIPNFKQRLAEGKITYRGLGVGKLSDDFYNLAGENGTRIKVDGKEYYITDTEFDSFSRGSDGKLIIKFDAPYKKGYAEGGETEWFDYSNVNLKKLPYGLDKYFIKTPNTKRLLMSTLQPTRARKEGVKNANKLMMDSYNGKVDRRKPISVKRVRGKYEIIDGNSTFANAKFSGWKFIYADVTKNPTSSKGDTIFEIAKKIRKENEPWKEAVKRANQMKKNG